MVIIAILFVRVLPLDLRDYKILLYKLMYELSLEGIKCKRHTDYKDFVAKIYHFEDMAALIASLHFAILNC